MAHRIRVGVVFGGRSGEHEVSLVSAASVMNALDREKYEVVPIGIAKDGRWISSGEALRVLTQGTHIAREPERFLVPEPHRQALVTADGKTDPAVTLDVVFPLIHGTYGEDGTLQGLLELANIPYVGAGVLASAVGMDKIVQKQLYKQAGLPGPKFLWFLSSLCTARPRTVVASVEGSLRYPVFVKPANTGSSVGITKAHDRQELTRDLAVAAEYDRKVIIEEGIRNAREIEVSVLGNDVPMVSVPGEIIPSNEFYDYDAKYVDGKSTAVIPADLPTTVVRLIQKYALRAYTAVDCAGLARVDFFVTKKSLKVYVNELNTLPGFTSISMYPKLWEASGISYSDLLDRLITMAFERHEEKNKLKRTYRPTRDWYKG